MTVTAEDIKLVLSGGEYNSNPYDSLGGDPSLRVVWGTTNNLYDDVTSDQALDGYIDYRCIYAVNNNEDSSFYSSRIYVENQVDEGSDIEIGVAKETDIQQVIVSGIAEGGSFTLQYEDEQFEVDWNVDIQQWAINLQNELNGLDPLTDVVVTVSSYRNDGSTRDLTRIFEIQFLGVDNNRYHPILVLVTNAITPTSPIIEIYKTKNGCPINSIAPEIEVETTLPFGVNFVSTDADNPILIGTLNAGDSFPIWVKRTTSVEAEPLSSDGFTLRMMGRPF